MIITRFDNLNNFGPSAVMDMPGPVREGEYVEFDGESFRVTAVSWIIEPGKPVELVARIR
ncbi:hypothetical protein SEA_LILHUDDY_83 [Arthrobacter phage LilHuddy]|nr:hypothetical protein SEA_LILHUDDY_83 [Arthrobacter phage LilHuddy]